MQATKAVKGTLNKLTPEKFERLLQQLVDVVTSAEILHTTISLVFESAVAQPTFVAMYADLCDRLSKVCHARPFFEKSSKVACCVCQHTLGWPRACTCHLLGPGQDVPKMHIIGSCNLQFLSPNSLMLQELQTDQQMGNLLWYIQADAFAWSHPSRHCTFDAATARVSAARGGAPAHVIS